MLSDSARAETAVRASRSSVEVIMEPSSAQDTAAQEIQDAEGGIEGGRQDRQGDQGRDAARGDDAIVDLRAYRAIQLAPIC